MSANLKLIPRAERLLEGKITADMTDSQTTITVDNPPLIAELPSYLEIDPDSSTFRELCRVINVSGLTITLERGLNNGGTGFPHTNNTPYKFKFTSRHWEAVATALESGYLFEDASYGFAKVTTSSFKITAAGVDRTDTYTKGRKVRLNGTTVVTIVSSSYSNPDTTIVVDDTTVPATITSVELQIVTKGDTDLANWLISKNKATGATINTGTSDTTIVTPKAIADSTIAKSKATAAENVAGTDDAKYLTALANVPAFNNSLYRQALINGNFDVWQRGTSLAGGTGGVTTVYAADRWNTYNGSAASTFSQQDGTGVPGSRYSIRCQRNNGQTATTTTHLATALETSESIKFRGVKMTLSFWAKCGANYSPASSALVASIVTGKGTDQNIYAGFTSSANAISETKTLTTSWQKFTSTTTNVIASDITQIGVQFACTPVGTAGANDWFEITQVQLCAGDVALPFMPKSFEEELRACQRYYQKSFPYATAPAQAVGSYAGAIAVKVQVAAANKYSSVWVNFPTRMRIAPTPTWYNPISANTKFYNRGASADSAEGATSFSETNENGMSVENAQVAADAVGQSCYVHYAVQAEL